MDIEFFRTLIIKTRKNLQLQNAEIPEGVELDQSRVGRLSRMDAMQGHEMTLEARRRRAVDIKRMDEALIRIENDDFGYCEACGEIIAVGRLEIDPAAQYCVPCANTNEQ
jgi:DnaK suppressor protein